MVEDLILGALSHAAMQSDIDQNVNADSSRI